MKTACWEGRRVFWVEGTARTKAWRKGQHDAVKCSSSGRLSTRSEEGG